MSDDGTLFPAKDSEERLAVLQARSDYYRRGWEAGHAARVDELEAALEDIVTVYNGQLHLAFDSPEIIAARVLLARPESKT